MSWKNIPSDIIPYEGFVYKITDLDNQKVYIGIKKFWSLKKLKPLKGKKNKRISRIESDWKEYTSSNKQMQVLLAVYPSRFKKEIIRCCSSITEMKAWEAYYQLQYYTSGNWHLLYNEMINLRIRIRKEDDHE